MLVGRAGLVRPDPPPAPRWGVALHKDHDHPHDHMGRPGPARYAGPRARSIRSAWPGRSARARRPWSNALPRSLARGEPRGHHQRHLHARGRRVPVATRALPVERIVGVQTGGCPHTAIRDDASATSAPSPISSGSSPTSSWCWSNPAATTLRPSSRASWPTASSS